MGFRQDTWPYTRNVPITLGLNLAGLRAQRELAKAGDALSRTFERLSSGARLASDDSASCAIGTSLKASSRVLGRALGNINDGVSMLSVADSAFEAMGSIVQRLAELAEQAANGVYAPAQRQALDTEAQQLALEYRRILGSTQYNGMKLLDGSLGAVAIQVGNDSSAASRIDVTIPAMNNDAVATGQYTALAEQFLPFRIYALRSGDFNEDGVSDLMVSTDSGNMFGVMLNNGDGTFRYQSLISAAVAPVLDPVDLNGDGHLDTVVEDSFQKRLLLGNGNGTFSFTNLEPFTSAPAGFFADVTGDGKLDLVTSSAALNAVYVRIGNGNGTFASTITSTFAEPRNGLTYGDMNNDGRADLLTRHTGYSMFRASNGDGTWAAGVTVPVQGVNTTNFLADVNNDGILDLIQGNNSYTYTHLGNGNGSFKAPITAGPLPGDDSLIVDLNEDGKLDLIVLSSTSNTLRTHFGNGDGTFLAPLQSATATKLYNGTFGDFNGDGAIDIIGGGFDSKNLSVFMSVAVSSSALPDFSLESQILARAALDDFTNVIANLGTARGIIGAHQSRLSVAMQSAQSMRLNYEQAASRIIDVDIAAETAELVRLQILEKAAASVLAHSNQSMELVKTLLQA
jgi:flagellin